jgi:hypothetical protein
LGFAATVAGPGVYRARLSAEMDATGEATAYAGASADVGVAA